MHLSCGAGEDSWESLGLQGDQSVHSKRNQSWIFIGRTEAEAEAPILWPPDVKNWLIWKDPDAGKDWRQEKGMTEDEMFGWRHWLDGHEFEQALGVGDRQGSLACSSPWGRKESDTTERLNWTESNLKTALPWKGEMGSEDHGRGWRTIVVVQSLSCIPLFEIPWTAALQASLSTPSPWDCLNSCPSSWWRHPAISSSVVPVSSWLQSYPAAGSFPMSRLCASRQ